MALPNSAAYKQSNSFLAGAFIPGNSTIAYMPAYAGGGATGAIFPDLASGYGSTTWRNGVEIGGTANGSSDFPIYYTLYSDTYTQGTTTSGNSLPVVWGVTTGNSTTDILNLVNKLPAMYPITKHTTYSQAATWLVINGYFLANRNYPAIMYNSSTPMISAFDPSFSASYPLTGTDLYDLTGNTTSPAAIQGTASWDSTNKNAVLIASGGYIALPNPIFSNYDLATYPTNSLTLSIWFYLSTLPGNNIIETLFNITDAQSGTTNRPAGTPQSFNCWMCIYVDSFGDVYFEGDPQRVGGTIPAPTKINSTAISTGAWHNITVSANFAIQNSNLGVCIDGTLSINTYAWTNSSQINSSPNGFGLLGSSAQDQSGTPLANTGIINGRLGAFYIYWGELTNTQKQDIRVKTALIYP
jgi:hypothetical protein